MQSILGWLACARQNPYQNLAVAYVIAFLKIYGKGLYKANEMN